METEVITTLVGMTCGQCGCVFGIESNQYRQLKGKGGRFYCTNGHCRVFREPDVARLERQLAAERARHDQTRSELKTVERRRRAAVGQTTKLKHRIEQGLCPCCNRFFRDLAQHVHQEHPDFVAAETESITQ